MTMLANRIMKGADAFIAGHVLARELAKREASLKDLQLALRREDPAALASLAAGVAVTAWAFLRERELAILFSAGAVVGSGILEKGIDLLIQQIDGDRPRVVTVAPEAFTFR